MYLSIYTYLNAWGGVLIRIPQEEMEELRKTVYISLGMESRLLIVFFFKLYCLFVCVLGVGGREVPTVFHKIG